MSRVTLTYEVRGDQAERTVASENFSRDERGVFLVLKRGPREQGQEPPTHQIFIPWGRVYSIEETI